MFQSNFPQTVFHGIFSHGLDAKGRVSLPSAFRLVLGDDDRLVVWPSFGSSEEPCYLEGGRVEILSQYMSKLPGDSKLRRLLTHYIHGESRILGFDSTGRVLLPREFMEHAGLKGRQALFLGLHDRFQIWNPETYAGYKEGLDERCAEERAELAACIGVGLP